MGFKSLKASFWLIKGNSASALSQNGAQNAGKCWQLHVKERIKQGLKKQQVRMTVCRKDQHK